LTKFDCVIANPPFALKNWGAAQFASDVYGRNIWGSPTDYNGDFAWLQHMVASMHPKIGRCAVVLPQGVLFRGGKEGEMRKKLIESDKLECVIALVSGIFYSTGVSACILVLNNNKSPDHKEKVCLIDASGMYTPQRAQNIMTEQNVEDVFALHERYEDAPEKAKVASLQEIRDKDYSLSVSNYIERAPVETVAPSVVRARFHAALEDVKTAEEKLMKLLTEGGYVRE
jgi:type I restriction enzyme M protein